jgi:hypothetical protein
MADTQDPKREAFQRKCSIIISLIASMLLVNNLGSQNAAGAASFQNAAAINTYAFFQAKNIRQNDLNLAELKTTFKDASGGEKILNFPFVEFKCS